LFLADLVGVSCERLRVFDDSSPAGLQLSALREPSHEAQRRNGLHDIAQVMSAVTGDGPISPVGPSRIPIRAIFGGTGCEPRSYACESISAPKVRPVLHLAEEQFRSRLRFARRVEYPEITNAQWKVARYWDCFVGTPISQLLSLKTLKRTWEVQSGLACWP
jgi:hypothetical protein